MKSLKDKIISSALSGILALSVWTVKTVSDLRAQVAGLDARITALTNSKPNQIAQNETD